MTVARLTALYEKIVLTEFLAYIHLGELIMVSCHHGTWRDYCELCVVWLCQFCIHWYPIRWNRRDCTQTDGPCEPGVQGIGGAIAACDGRDCWTFL